MMCVVNTAISYSCEAWTISSVIMRKNPGSLAIQKNVKNIMERQDQQ